MEFSFYRPTQLYKELVLLELMEKEENITQRKMSEVLNCSVAMTNIYINALEEKGLIKREHITSKEVLYHVTEKGKETRKHYSLIYMSESQKMYDSAKEELLKFINDIKSRGFKSILLYGAGEVAEIFLSAIKDEIEVLAVIDDNNQKQGKELVNTLIISRDDIEKHKHDGILISSYVHYKNMLKKLKEISYPQNKILYFV